MVLLSEAGTALTHFPTMQKFVLALVEQIRTRVMAATFLSARFMVPKTKQTVEMVTTLGNTFSISIMPTNAPWAWKCTWST